MDEVGHIRLESDPQRSLIHLPDKEAEFSLTRGSAWRRLISVGAAAFGILYAAMPFLLPYVRDPRPHRTLDWADRRLTILLLSMAAFTLAIFLLACWGMALGIFLRFFPLRKRLVVDQAEVLTVSRRGPCRWTRRFGGVTALYLGRPANAGHVWLKQPVEKKECRLLADLGSKRWRVLAAGRYPEMLEVAQTLARSIARHTACTPPQLVDGVDPQRRQDDRSVALPGRQYVIERIGRRVSIEPRVEVAMWSRLRTDRVFRSGVWIALLTTALTAAMSWCVQDSSGIFAIQMRRLQIGSWAVGSLLLAGGWYGQALRRRYLIDETGMEKEMACGPWRKSRRWQRSQIRGVRTGSRIGDKGAHSDELQLVLQDTQSVPLEQSEYPRLAHLATLLRRELGVGTGADGAFGACEAPVGCSFTVSEGKGWVQVIRARAGWRGQRTAAIVTGGVMLAACGVLCAMGRRFAVEDQRAAGALAAFLGLFGLCSLFAALYEATLRYQIRMDRASGLTLFKDWALRSKLVQMERGEFARILAIELLNNPGAPYARLAAQTPSGRKRTLMRWYAKEMAYVASVIEQHREAWS